MPRPAGPCLGMAVFCEQVTADPDGALTVTRIGNQVTRPAGSEVLKVGAVFALIPGGLGGMRALTVCVKTPSGRALPTQSFPIVAERSDQMLAVFVNLSLEVTETGVYWFEVRLDDRSLTWMPLRVVGDDRVKAKQGT